MTPPSDLRQTPMSPGDALSDESRLARGDGRYRVNELFYSVQGEGRHAGTMMVFVRFSDCNLRCARSNAGFDCDTEFTSGLAKSASEILDDARRLSPKCRWLLLTGGEPGLQVDPPLIDAAHGAGYRIAIETNGTVRLPPGIDWITVSPKSAEHTLRQRVASEVKYVRSAGMALPETVVRADHHLVSPAFQPDGSVRLEDLDWCLSLIAENPAWLLSLQLHKLIARR
jgi:7-carboxy-7-deazaguanine synthase